MQNKLINFFLFAFILISNLSNAQEKKTEQNKIRYFEVGLGLPYLTFRDKTTTALSYSGYGIGSLNLGNSKQDANKIFREYCFNTTVIGAKPDLKNLTLWNKGANIINYNFFWRKLKGIGESKDGTWNYFLGGSFIHNGQLAIIPSANNSFAYNFNLFQLGLEGMIKRDIHWGNKSFQFTYQASLPFVGLNVRPQSYIGLPPQSSIWGEISNVDALFVAPKFASLHNNFIFRNDISLDKNLGRNKLRLQYRWQFTHNTVAVNSLNSVAAAINLSYLIKLKNK